MQGHKLQQRALLVTFSIALMGATKPAPPVPEGAPSAARTQALPGDDLFAQGRFEEAARVYEDSAKAAPGSGPALARLARARLYEGRESEALDLAQKALAMAPGDPVATATMGMARVRQRNFGADFYEIENPEVTGSVPFVITDPLPVVHVTIGERQATFLIDTGAPDIMLRRPFAEALGLPISEGGVGVFAGGLQGRVERTVVPELEIGGIRIRNVPAGINPSADGLKLPGVELDGVIGTGLLMHFLSTLDYCTGKLTLAPRDTSAAFQARAAEGGANIVPFWFVGDHFIFARGKLNQAEGLFLIDTGLAGGGLVAPKATLDAAGVTIDESKTMTGQGGGGAVQFVPFRAAATLGNLTRDDLPGVYMPGGGNPLSAFPFRSSGMISHGFFRESRLTFDFEAMKLATESCQAGNDVRGSKADSLLPTH
ncbi:MAG: aspartyl protease family protein [Porphyrobacter sp.]|nr:aspartyl protease family protein [Porphyrobacter sp.]